jgi:hypothetical protein
MSKRRTSDLVLPAKDHWDTPASAVAPLLRHLLPTVITEPCGGAGALAAHLRAAGIEVAEAYDIAPRADGIEVGDAAVRVPRHMAVTNPPFSRAACLPILMAACGWPHGAWFLLPSDALMNRWFAPVSSHVAEIVPIGRVSWLANGKGGFENFGWARIAPHVSGLLRGRA